MEDYKGIKGINVTFPVSELEALTKVLQAGHTIWGGFCAVSKRGKTYRLSSINPDTGDDTYKYYKNPAHALFAYFMKSKHQRGDIHITEPS